MKTSTAKIHSVRLYTTDGKKIDLQVPANKIKQLRLAIFYCHHVEPGIVQVHNNDGKIIAQLDPSKLRPVVVVR